MFSARPGTMFSKAPLPPTAAINFPATLMPTTLPSSLPPTFPSSFPTTSLRHLPAMPPPHGIAFISPPIIARRGLWPLRRLVIVDSMGPNTIGGTPRAVKSPFLHLVICQISVQVNPLSLYNFKPSFLPFYSSMLSLQIFSPHARCFPKFFTPLCVFQIILSLTTLFFHPFHSLPYFPSDPLNPLPHFPSNSFYFAPCLSPNLFYTSLDFYSICSAPLQIFLSTQLMPRHIFPPTHLKHSNRIEETPQSLYSTCLSS